MTVHKLVVELPGEVYDPLADKAKHKGTTPEQLAVEWLTAVSCFAMRDPLEEFIGAFRSDVPDWANQHDKYLGAGSMSELNPDAAPES
jgi:hypothetical protein